IYTTLGEIDSIVGDKNYPAVEEDRLNEADREIYDEVKNLSQRFNEAMNEDFNTALAIGHIYNIVRNLNRYFSSREFAATDQVCAIIAEAKTIFSRIGKILGLFQVPSAEYLGRVKNKKRAQLDITVDEIEILVEERNQARKEKNWDRADQIRETLLKKNIILKDGREKTTWKIK
ncbi:MAG: cysteine--tRNA ligase, partial [Deltaproteobacteria bacterium]|nr:cysteine--tRNA ligase [Deltaproteobacteria bacterium]